MLRRLPLLPTLIVLAAIALMIRLGFWQLDRKVEKETLIARYEEALSDSAELNSVDQWFRNGRELLYRRANFVCRDVLRWESIAGRSAKGATGFAHVAQCAHENVWTFDGPSHHADIVIGWSNRPDNPDWKGGLVSGTIAPGGKIGFRLIADPPLAGLEANALPDPRDLPNNHLAYAVQWFLFALTALVIYILALRKRLHQSSPERGGGSPQG